jgi:urease accessory protein
LSGCDLRIRAEAGSGVGDAGATVISELRGTEPWRPRILGPVDDTGWARVALVQTRASLITADDITVEVSVGPGAALELVELGALLAMNARDGRQAQLTAAIDVAAGGRLIWLGQPWIVAAGAVVESRVTLSLAAGAVVLRGESVVLGRSGEPAGALSSRTRITLDAAPLLDETLHTGDRSVLRSPVVAGAARMIGAVTLAGVRDDDPPEAAMQADGPATLWRGAGPTVETNAASADASARWREIVMSRPVRDLFEQQLEESVRGAKERSGQADRGRVIE